MKKVVYATDTGQNIEVFNLATGEEMLFMGVLPSEAVIFANLYANGQCNTHEWPRLYMDMYPRLTWGGSTVAYGDWCAKR